MTVTLHTRWAWALATLVAGCGYEGVEDLIDLGSSSGVQTCTLPAGFSVTRLEVGRGYSFLSGSMGDEPFVPLAEGATLPIERGTQGADMVILRVRIADTAPSDCVPQSTELRNAAGDRVGFSYRPIGLQARANGEQLSPGLFYPGDWRPGVHTLTTTLGGMTFTRTVNVQ